MRWVASHKWGVSIILLVIAALIGGRLYLNVWLPNHVNEALNRIEGYEGSVEDIDIALYRGAYQIHKLKLYKKTGHIPTPFIDIETVDLSIQWSALLHGRIVSDADLINPVINFAVNPAGTVKQTGIGVDWTKPIKDLMPIDINLVTFKDGKLTYQDFSTTPKVNLYIHHMSGEARNLRNVVDASQKLPSTLWVKGDSIGGGALEIKGRMNILRPIPDMDLETKLENVHLPALNNYTNAYAAVDVKEGRLDLYSQIIVKDGQLSGYAKPIATKVAIIDLSKKTNPLKLAWESVVAIVVEVFTNQRRNQFATKIPLSGSLSNIDTEILPAIAGIVRNAFFEAIKRGFDTSSKSREREAPPA